MTTDNRAAEICEEIATKTAAKLAGESFFGRERIVYTAIQSALQAIRSQSAQEPVAHKWSADGVCTVCDTDSESHQYINAKKFGFDTCVARPVTTPAVQEPVAVSRDDITRIVYAYEGAVQEANDNPDDGAEALEIARADLLALLQNAKRWADAHPVTTTAEQGEKVSVPREPTLEMMQAALEWNRREKPCNVVIGREYFVAQNFYREMLAASEQGES